MIDLIPADFSEIYLLPVLIIVLLLLWLIVRARRGRARSLAHAFDKIAFERIEDLVIPSADGGEIQIDYLLLTAQGLLIIDIKDFNGAVFGSDKMQDWTVISEKHRFTFANPQSALCDRIAAVRQIVRQVPVAGRIVFLDGASFTKGVPALVSSLDGLIDEFVEKDKAAAMVNIEAFIPHWELIHAKADLAVARGKKRKGPRL